MGSVSREEARWESWAPRLPIGHKDRVRRPPAADDAALPLPIQEASRHDDCGELQASELKLLLRARGISFPASSDRTQLLQLLRNSSAEATKGGPLKVGSVVRIHSLHSDKDLNGQEGTCKELDAASGRWLVALH